MSSNRTITGLECVYRILDYLLDHFCEKTPELSFEKVGINNERRDNILVWMQREELIYGLTYAQTLNGSIKVAGFCNMVITLKGMEWFEKYSKYFGN